MTALRHGDTLGLLGGGQLGRMLALAAARLGLDVHVFSPEPRSPAARVAAEETVAAYDDHDAVRRFAATCDVVTFEFENVPAATLAAAGEVAPVRPGAAALAITQDRVAEKTFAREIGAGAVDFRAIASLADLREGVAALGLPCVLKTRRFGYDGKGQAWIRAHDELDAAWAAIEQRPAILEAAATFARELSIVAVRALDGAFATYALAENVHESGVLRRSTAPAAVSTATRAEAERVARAFAERLDYVGAFAIEFFEVAGELWVNEIAPRVHNSGHWTLDAAVCDQFENHVRAVAGLPLGSTRAHARAVMTNLFGDEVGDLARLGGEPTAHLHLYGKRDLLAGRKTGHATRLAPLADEAAPPPDVA